MKLTFVNHSLYAALLGLGAAVMLTGCNGFVYEDLPDCQNNAQVRLRFTRNMTGEDRFGSDVHCSRIFLYDGQGNLISSFTPEGNAIDIPLYEGTYHAIAYGGMNCDQSSFGYNIDPNQTHRYTGLVSELLGARTVTESASPLHSHFQGFADFSIKNVQDAHVPVEIDLTKNTNHITLELSYKDGLPIAAGAYTATITADNASIGHDGYIVKNGTPVTYKPYWSGLAALSFSEKPVSCIKEEFDLAKIDAADSPVLNIYDADGQVAFTKPLVELLEIAHRHEMPGADMNEYLDRQDNWVVQIMDIVATEAFTAVTMSVNGWIIVNNKYDL